MSPAPVAGDMKAGSGREDAKRRAGESAADLASDGDLVGLGTGSTAAHAIRALGRRRCWPMGRLAAIAAVVLDAPDPLAAAALTTHHAGAFVLVPLLVAHLTGALGDLLAGVGTVPGLALFAALWAVLRPASGRWLSACDPDRPSSAVGAGARYGAFAGLAFLPVPILAAGIVTGELALVVFLLGAGALVAPLVGAVAGVVLGLGDLLVLRGARRLAPDP